MLKAYLATHNISIYSISKSSGISYSTLNDIVNCKVEIANVKAGIVYSLATILGISMDTLFELCKSDIIVRSERYDIDGFVSRKNKKYYLHFEYKHKKSGIVINGLLLDITDGSLQGSLEKSWTILDGERGMLKGNRNQFSTESINEVFASRLHKMQGFDAYTEYKLIKIHGQDIIISVGKVAGNEESGEEL